MTYQEALVIHWTVKIRSPRKLREAARAVFAQGRTRDYPVVVALYNRAEAVETKREAAQ